MELRTRPLRIAWAVDPLGEEFDFQKKAAHFLRMLADRTPVEIFPIYLYGSYPLEYSPYSHVDMSPADRARTKSTLVSICEKDAIRGIHDLEIIVKGFTNLRKGVRTLVERAAELDVDLVFATTHARRGISRWVVGSFAEALMEESTIPLLVLNPESEVVWDLGEALFATDLSAESRCAFRTFLPLAAALRSKVTIYHQGAHSLAEGLVPAFSGGIISATGEKAEAENRWSEAVAKAWRDSAKSAGVEGDVLVDASLARTPAEGALDSAQERKAWIAIAAQSRPTRTGMIGSNARRVLRDARVPVWLYRTPRGSALCDPIDFEEENVARDLRLDPRPEEEAR